MKIFIGYDDRERIAFHVLVHSILRRASKPVEIVPLVRQHLLDIHKRPRGPKDSTDFSITRFLTPALSRYEGYSLFLDSDMLVQCDVTKIDFDPKKTVSVVKHDYEPTTTMKFLGQKQTRYPRKNWSSVMLFNNARCRVLAPSVVDSVEPLYLHRFQWCDDADIGEFPLDYNHLVGEYPPNAAAKILHYTLGGPWFGGEYADCDHAELWGAELDHMLGMKSA